MTLSRRIQKLEVQRGESRGPKVIIRPILWQGSEKPIAWLGRALTPDGWKTVSAGSEVSEEEFSKRLWSMADGAEVLNS